MKTTHYTTRSEPLVYEALPTRDEIEGGTTLRKILVSILTQKDRNEGDLPVIA